MRTLRDAATLATLILLTLTFRVDTKQPSPIDLVTPAHAATRSAQVHEPAPALLPPTAVEAGIASLPSFARRVELKRAAAALPMDVAMPHSPGGERRLVWELDGKRVVIVLGAGDEPPAPPAVQEDVSTTCPSACDARRARTSC